MRTTIVTAAVLVAGLALAYGDDRGSKKPPTQEQIKERMKRVHKGDKAPLARLKKELQAEAPDWATVGQDSKALTEMADMLLSAGGYTDPRPYHKSAQALATAAGKKDRPAAATALQGLTKSCASCHYYGGAAGGL